MMLKYIGEREVDLIPNKFYKAVKTNDELGEGYAIFDEGEDWYRYGKKYVEKNFEVASVVSEFETAGSVAV